MKPQARVGVGVLIFCGEEVLVGKRRNAHGVGAWAQTGGHLDVNNWPFVIITAGIIDNATEMVEAVKIFC